MKLKDFIKYCVEESAFQGCDLDGCDRNGWDVQDYAVKCGILVEVPYDPAKHGDDHDIEPEPGDPWFEFSPEFKAFTDS